MRPWELELRFDLPVGEGSETVGDCSSTRHPLECCVSPADVLLIFGIHVWPLRTIDT